MARGPNRTARKLVVTLLALQVSAVGVGEACDLLLKDGQIVTLDPGGSIQSSIAISGNEILAVGVEVEGCTEVIELDGLTVVPGLIDNHVHWSARASRPGHHVGEMDKAFSAPEAVEILNRNVGRAPAVGAGEATADNFLTAVGGITRSQFSENRLPNATELAAVPRPVFLSAGFNGPSQTNEAGRDYFEDRGVAVNVDGSINNTNSARNALAQTQDEDDIRRGVIDTMAWSASVGLTTVLDMGTNGSSAHDPILDVAGDNEAFIRLRLFYGGVFSNTSQLENLVAALLNLDLPPDGEMVRARQLGEFINNTDLGGAIPLPANYGDAAAIVAENGLGYQQHAIPDSQASAFLDAWEDLNQVTPITDLRWQLGHVFDMSVQTMDRLNDLGAGFAMHGVNYAGLGGGSIPPGPPYRTALDNGVPVGAGSDGGNIVTIDPWNILYLMTTGLDDRGDVMLPPGETVTLTEALWMYSKGSAWFSSDEDRLGSLEVGKLADLVVLNDDILALETGGMLSDLRKVKSVLTIVDGNIVYSDGTLVACADADAFDVWYPKFAGDTCAGSAPSDPPAVPAENAGTSPMTVSKIDPEASAIGVSWDTTSCVDGAEHMLVYGEGSRLPVVLGGTYTPSGAVCGVGPQSPFNWVGTPTAQDSTGLIWWLMLVRDDSGDEGSWGEDVTGAERDGPGTGGSSGQCGVADKHLSNTCGL